MDWSLFVHRDGDVTEHPIVETTRVGRASGSEVRLTDPACSRLHFVVHRRDDGSYILEHKPPMDRSPGGTWQPIRTFLNGESVGTSVVLRLGDRISFVKAPTESDTIILVGASQTTPSPPGGSEPWWGFSQT